MAQFVVRNLENAVKARLQRRAKRHGRSMEEEVREILRVAVHEEDVPSAGLGTEIAGLFAKGGLDSDVPELLTPDPLVAAGLTSNLGHRSGQRPSLLLRSDLDCRYCPHGALLSFRPSRFFS